MLDGEELAGAPEARLDLVRDEEHPVTVAQLTQLAHEVEWRGDEAALAEHGLDDDRGDSLRGDLRLEEALEVAHRGLRRPAGVCVARSSCSCTACITRGWAWPAFITPMPPAKSM